MAAVGDTSVHETPRRRWFESGPVRPRARIASAPQTPYVPQTTGFSRRLASLGAAQLLSDIFFVVETGMISLLGVLAMIFSLGGPLTVSAFLQPQALPFLLVPVAIATLLKAKALYDFEQLSSFSGSIAKVLLCSCLTYFVALAVDIGLGSGDTSSSLWLGLWMLATLSGQLVLRAAASWCCAWLAATGAVHQALALYGDRAATQHAMDTLARIEGATKLVGVFGSTDMATTAPDPHFDGDLAALIGGARANAFDTIIIATSGISNDDIRRLLARLENLPCAVQIYFTFKNETTGHWSKPALTLFDVQAKPISGWGRLLKRGLDVTLAGAGIICLAPFFLVAAVAIKLDSPGPVFFSQRRHGLNRQVFRIFKLRTMTVMEEGDQAVQAARKDARVTRIGGLLRKSSLDELPQLLNVLKGEMSLVGPRPHPLSLDDQYTDHLEIYSSRHKVKPGITGWAQINGHRGPTDQPGLMQRRVQHDLHYIDNWSLWLDLKIIAATPFLGFIHKNAV